MNVDVTKFDAYGIVSSVLYDYKQSMREHDWLLLLVAFADRFEVNDVHFGKSKFFKNCGYDRPESPYMRLNQMLDRRRGRGA